MSTGPFISDAEVKKRNPALIHGTSFDRDFNNRVVKKHDLPATMGLALVDLTDGMTRYAVNKQEHVEKHVFSLAKIGPMLAAFRLRERLRNEFSGSPAGNINELIDKIEKAWKPQVTSKSHSLGWDDFPNVLKIFDIPDKPPFSFEFDGLRSDWDVLQAIAKNPKDKTGSIPKDVIDILPFADRLKLSIRMSDDNAAGSVIDDLGLSYIYATLVSEGLYSPQNHGLWISNTYGYNSKFAGYEAPKGEISAGATAYTIALFFTLMYQRKFFALGQDNQDMLDLMREQSASGIGTSSLFSRGGSYIQPTEVTYSKIGLDIFDKGHDARASEGAIIERVLPTTEGPLKQLKYVAVALQAAHAVNLQGVIMNFDMFLAGLNGCCDDWHELPD
jgi:hypothetical protein